MSVRLDDIIRYLNEQEHSLSHMLMPNLGRSAKSVGIRRHSVWVKSSGTFADAEFQETLADVERASRPFSVDKHMPILPRPADAPTNGEAYR